MRTRKRSKAVQETAARGLSFGAPTELELEMAELLVGLLPGFREGAPGEFGH